MMMIEQTAKVNLKHKKFESETRNIPNQSWKYCIIVLEETCPRIK